MKVGSAPSGSLSARIEVGGAGEFDAAAVAARHVNRAKSLEDISTAGGLVSSALLRLAPSQRENVVQMQKAFLDYRRLVLKTQIVDVHMQAHDADSALLPQIRKLAQEKLKLQKELILLEREMQKSDESYYESSQILSSSVRGMVRSIKLVNAPLLEVMKRLEELYKKHIDSEVPADPTEVEEVTVTVNKFRAFLPILEDALLLNKPLSGRDHALQEKLTELEAKTSEMKAEVASLSEAVAMTRLDCETMREFGERADAIAELVEEVSERSSDIYPWLKAPSSQVHQTLSRAFLSLREETSSLQAFREPNFLNVLDSLSQQSDISRSEDFELSDDGSLAYVTPDKLVELIITGKGAAYAIDFPRIFVNTFPLVFSPLELLEKVVLIYCTVPADGQGSDRQNDERKLAPCRLRILNLLKKWIVTHKYDFEDRAVSQLVHDFLDNTLKLTGYERIAENLSNLLSVSSWPQPLEGPKSIYPPNKESLDLLDIDPLELARQMTLDDLVLYSSLEVRDFLSCEWSDRATPEKARTIRAMTDNFNVTAEWVTGTLLSPVMDDQTRGKCIRHFILTASELLKMNNFNSCVKILGALGGQAIFRLHTWDRVPKEDVKVYEDMRGLIANHWAGLRELMATCKPPSIPVISPFLGDLTYIAEMKAKRNNMYNFRKLLLTSQAIDKALRHIDFRYWFNDIPEIRRWIKACEKNKRMTPEKAHEMSLLIQPREA